MKENHFYILMEIIKSLIIHDKNQRSMLVFHLFQTKVLFERSNDSFQSIFYNWILKDDFMEKHILLIDGMALLFRGYYATYTQVERFRRSDGTPMNGVQQFLRYFFHAIETFQPTHVLCCWDVEGDTFRTSLYPEYKANRKAPPEALIPQFDLIKQVIFALKIPNIYLEKFEADDCIGSLAKQFGESHSVTILSVDKDLLQLVDQNIQVVLMKRGMGSYNVFNQKNFHQKVSLHPQQMIDYKALVGDPADNYPGVYGIGKKTALQLLNEYETLEKVFENLDKLLPRLQVKLRKDYENLMLYRKLSTIRCDLPLSCSLETSVWDLKDEKIDYTLKNFELYR